MVLGTLPKTCALTLREKQAWLGLAKLGPIYPGNAVSPNLKATLQSRSPQRGPRDEPYADARTFTNSSHDPADRRQGRSLSHIQLMTRILSGGRQRTSKKQVSAMSDHQQRALDNVHPPLPLNLLLCRCEETQYRPSMRSTRARQCLTL